MDYRHNKQIERGDKWAGNDNDGSNFNIVFYKFYIGIYRFPWWHFDMSHKVQMLMVKLMMAEYHLAASVSQTFFHRHVCSCFAAGCPIKPRERYTLDQHQPGVWLLVLTDEMLTFEQDMDTELCHQNKKNLS